MNEHYARRWIDGSETKAMPDGLAVFAPPATGIFLAGLQGEASLAFPMEMDGEIKEQAFERRMLDHMTRSLFDAISDSRIDWHEALAGGQITEQIMTEFFRSYAEFLHKDTSNARLILYFPMEFLPDVRVKTEYGDSLKNAQHAFVLSWRKSWFTLLDQSVMRANFTDGDVLETGMGKPPRVRKAAHLIPDALKRGLITEDELTQLLVQTTDAELEQSVTEGLLAAIGQQIISQTDFDRIVGKNYRKQTISDTIASIRFNRNDPRVMIEPLGRDTGNWLRSVEQSVFDSLDVLDALYNSSYTKGMSPARMKWERQSRREHIISDHARIVAKYIALQNLPLESLFTQTPVHRYGEDQMAFLLQSAVRGAILCQREHPIYARKIADTVISYIASNKEMNVSSASSSVVSSVNQLVHAKLINESSATALGIAVHDLSLPFPLSLDEFIRDDAAVYDKTVQAIEQDTDLSRYMYPMALAMGSRVKGYANDHADIDIGIVFRPETPFSIRDGLLRHLVECVPGLERIDRIWELWTAGNPDFGLSFRYIHNPPDSVIDYPQVYMPLGAVWVGKTDVTRSVVTQLLEGYLKLERFGEDQRAVREMLLGELELDSIQYRLLHKGYRRFYPDLRGDGGQYSGAVDWESDFWDSGFRRVATLLFLSRVFLPDNTRE